MFGRRPAKTHRRLALNELAQSYGHFLQAAGHAAGGATTRFSPGYGQARQAAVRNWIATRGAFTPLIHQMREGAARARREYRPPKRNRVSTFVGLAAAGAAIGAAGAMAVRRRRAAAEWSEYEPVPPIEEPRHGAEPAGPSAKQKVTTGAASVAESVSARAGKMADSLHGRASRRTAEAGPESTQAPPPESAQKPRAGRESPAPPAGGPGTAAPGTSSGPSRRPSSPNTSQAKESQAKEKSPGTST